MTIYVINIHYTLMTILGHMSECPCSGTRHKVISKKTTFEMFTMAQHISALFLTDFLKVFHSETLSNFFQRRTFGLIEAPLPELKKYFQTIFALRWNNNSQA